MAEDKCCVRLDAADWDKKEIEWKDNPFYKAKYRTIFHIPLNIGSVMPGLKNLFFDKFKGSRKLGTSIDKGDRTASHQIQVGCAQIGIGPQG